MDDQPTTYFDGISTFARAYKNHRLVALITDDDARWLEQRAAAEDRSVASIVREGIRKMRSESEG